MANTITSNSSAALSRAATTMQRSAALTASAEGDTFDLTNSMTLNAPASLSFLSTPTQQPVQDATASSSANYPRSEYALGQAIAQTSSTFVDQLWSSSPAVASDGSIGDNTGHYENVSIQRGAIWTTLLGVEQNNSGDIAAAISAMNYAFNHQRSDGSFSNADATTSAANDEDDAFFLQSFARIFLGVQSSPLWSTYGSQLTALLPKFASAMAWLTTQAPALSVADAQASNRLFFDAIAFELGGQILNDSKLISVGTSFVNQALAEQSSAGYYPEHGGYDSSYNGTSMLNVEVLMTYSNNSAQVTQLAQSLAKAAAWEETRIAPNGAVSTLGNTRTAGQETDPGGSVKTVSYPEVATSLFYAGAILNSPAATSAANAVSAYGLVHVGGVAQPTPPGTLTTITPNGAGIATGTSGDNNLVATGPGQTLIGNGGNDTFTINNYTDAKIVVPAGVGITTVITTASNYVLAPGVDNLAVKGSNNHVVTGNGGNNYITGSPANDTIVGGGGNVVIKVGTGSNTLTGGGRYDVFTFPSAADHNNNITDFHPGFDVIDLRDMFAAGNWSTTTPSNYVQLSQAGANAVMSIDPTGQAGAGAHVLATLDNVTASKLVVGTDYII